MDGKLIIFSAPSGSGKTTIVKHLLQQIPTLGFSVSATTRSQRAGEADGKDYYFLSQQDFKEKIDSGEMIEWEEVYQGTYYGTLSTEIERLWEKGKQVLFDVDVQGGLSIKKKYGEKALSIFVKVPSIEVLEQRLRSRGTDSEESIKTRLQKVQFEMGFQDDFDVVLINDNLQDAQKRAVELVQEFLAK